MSKDISVIPSAKRLIESLRNMGHDFHTAIADLIDNCITANATVINIMISFYNNEPYVLIADDGDGMDRNTIDEAMRFGANTTYNSKDLGKYGLGLKTASLSFCDKLTVISKSKSLADKKSKLYIRRWDLPYVYQKDDWFVNTLELEDLIDSEMKIIDRFLPEKKGTIILWSDMMSRSSMSLLYDTNSILKEKQLAALISDTKNHLSLVFHRFIEGSVKGKARLKIFVNDIEIEPWDPFFKQEKETIFEEPNSYFIHDELGKKHEIIFTPVIIPREDSISLSGNKKNAMEADSKNNQQGFYFYRNDRLIKAGGWGGSTGNAGIFKIEEHYKLLRIAVDFHSALDKAFNLDITKMSAVLPSDKEFRRDLKERASAWRKIANDRYRKKFQDNLSSDESFEQQPSENQNKKEKYTSIESEKIINISKIKKKNLDITVPLDQFNKKSLHVFTSELIKIIEELISHRKKINEIDIIQIKKEFLKFNE